VEVQLDGVVGMISYFDPETRQMVIMGGDAILALTKHGWFLSDFSVTDAKNNPPKWKHKLTFMKSQGKTVEQAISAWKVNRPPPAGMEEFS
jgi:hypothetical protein